MPSLHSILSGSKLFAYGTVAASSGPRVKIISNPVVLFPAFPRTVEAGKQIIGPEIIIELQARRVCWSFKLGEYACNILGQNFISCFGQTQFFLHHININFIQQYSMKTRTETANFDSEHIMAFVYQGSR